MGVFICGGTMVLFVKELPENRRKLMFVSKKEREKVRIKPLMIYQYDNMRKVNFL